MPLELTYFGDRLFKFRQLVNDLSRMEVLEWRHPDANAELRR